MIYPFFKRAFDIAAAGLGLLIIAPLLLLLALAVRLRMGSPVLFKQTRAGRNETPFLIVKFRSMADARARDGSLLPDEQRLTLLGKLLRRSSLDELPELWNVLKGDMSLVGPRPLFMKYLPYYTNSERARFSVAPGITGLAQIKGRNNLPWDDRLALDVEYVHSRSLLLDLRILFGTIQSVLVSRGVVTAPRTAMLDLDEERKLKSTGGAPIAPMPERENAAH